MPTASNVVDSSARLEYLADGPNARAFAEAIQTTRELVVPTLVITEVARRLDAQGQRRLIPRVVAHMRQGEVLAVLTRRTQPARSGARSRGTARRS